MCIHQGKVGAYNLDFAGWRLLVLASGAIVERCRDLQPCGCNPSQDVIVVHEDPQCHVACVQC